MTGDRKRPLSEGFLVAHGVTLTEAYDVADAIAAAIRLALTFDGLARGRGFGPARLRRGG